MASPLLPGPGEGGARPPPSPGESWDVTVGRTIDEALDKLGIVGKLIQGLMHFTYWLYDTTITLLVSSMGAIALSVMKEVHRIKASNVATFDSLTVGMLGTIAGKPIATENLQGAQGEAARMRMAEIIGQAMMETIVGPIGEAAQHQVQPSAAPAERYMAKVMRIELGAWIEGLLMKMLSLKYLDEFTAAKDIIAKVMGIENIAPIVMRAPLNTLIAEPFEWRLNQLYRPKLLAPRFAMMAVRGGTMTHEEMRAEMALQGYSDERIKALMMDEERHLSASDWQYLIDRGVVTSDQAIADLRRAGWTPEMAALDLDVEHDRRLDSYRRRIAEEAREQYSRKRIDRAQFDRLLETTGLPDDERRMLVVLGGLQREYLRRDLTMGEMEQAVHRGLLTVQDYRRRLLELGYTFEDAETLELLLMGDIRSESEAREAREKREAARLTERVRTVEEQLARYGVTYDRGLPLAEKQALLSQAKRDQAAARLAGRDVSLADFEELVRRGIRTIDEYSEFLGGHDFSAEDAADLTELLRQQLDERAAAAERRAELERQAREKQIPLSDMESAARRGIITVQDLRTFLAEQGYSEADRGLMAAVVQAEIDERAAAARRREEAAARLKPRQVSLDDMELAVRRGIRSPEQYTAALLAQGFGSTDAELLTSLLRGQLADDEAARKARAAAAAQLKPRKISLGDLERAVRQGVRTVGEYRTILATQGFSGADQDTLTALLDLELQQDALARRKREEAAARVPTRALPLADVERAVQLGVLSVAQYTSMLERYGFGGEDREILRLSLVAELAETRRAQEARRRAGAALKKKGVSLAQMEAAVRQGMRSVYDYGVWLVEQGYTADAAGVLVRLLQSELDQAEAARRRREEIAGELAGRRISLSDQERAVREGIRTMREYVEYLAAQGYPAEDAATLVALLRGEMDAAQGVR